MLPKYKAHTEPEIILPHNRDRRSSWDTYRSAGVHGSGRIYAVRLGPFGIVFLALVFAFIAITMLLFLLSVVVIWLPAVALFVASAIISGLLRQVVDRAGRRIGS